MGNMLLSRWPFPVAHDPDFPIAASLAGTKDGDVLDVGANVGQSAYFFGSVLPDRRILAVEPFALTRSREAWLKRRLPNLDIVRVACSNVDDGSTLTMWTPELGPLKLDTATSTGLTSLKARMKSMFRLSYKLMSFQEKTVLVTTIDALQSSPALIKIDVEGHEILCLQGAVNTIRRYTPILLIEFTENRDEILKILSDLNYTAHVRSGSRLVSLIMAEDYPNLRNIFALPNTQ